MSVDVPADRVVRFHIRATLHGHQVETNHCFKRTTGPVTAGDLAIEANRIMIAWRFAMVLQLGSDVVWREVFAEDLTPGSTLSHTEPFFPGTGTQGPSHPANVAFSLMPFSAAIPRPWQWRVRLFGVPKSKTVGSYLDSSWAATMRTFLRDRYTLQGAFGWAPCVLQKTISGVPLPEAIVHLVTDYTIPSPAVSPRRKRLT